MSDTEHIKGKVKLLKFPKNYSFQDKIIFLVESGQLKENSYCVNSEWIEPDQDFIVANGQIFEVLEKEDLDPYDDISQLRKMTPDTYEFEFKFYNGGTCFSEMLEDALKAQKDE